MCTLDWKWDDRCVRRVCLNFVERKALVIGDSVTNPGTVILHTYDYEPGDLVPINATTHTSICVYHRSEECPYQPG